jgi:hypothetical protein
MYPILKTVLFIDKNGQEEYAYEGPKSMVQALVEGGMVDASIQAFYQIQNIINGIYSGFPLCCMLTFCILDDWSLPPGFVQDKTFGYDKERPGYVRCVYCRLIGRKVNVREGYIILIPFSLYDIDYSGRWRTIVKFTTSVLSLAYRC